MSAPSPRLGRLAFLALCAVPLAVKLPYLWRAWVTSPIDRAHLNIYGLLALVALGAAIAAARLRPARLRKKPAIPAVVSLSVFLAAYALGIMLDVNALQLTSAVCALWAASWLLWGVASAMLFAPAALLALLAVPGTLYWMQNISSSCALTSHAAFVPEFSTHSQSGMLGREISPSKGFARFFRTSDARQIVYADVSNTVSVLAVRVGSDIHEIHPATHCLRSGGWRVMSEKILQVEHPAGGALEVDEAIVDSSKGRLLVWIWYSSDDVSTGSFLHFRRMYSASACWRTYQVTTPVGEGEEGLAAARRLMQRFLAREKRT